MNNAPHNALRHHVSGAIARGEAVAIVEQPAMTQERWDSMTPAQRDAARDNSGLCAQLIGLEGKRVRVFPKREFGRSTFRVGISTGWRPCHLAMAPNARGSSDVLSERDTFEHVEILS